VALHRDEFALGEHVIEEREMVVPECMTVHGGLEEFNEATSPTVPCDLGDGSVERTQRENMRAGRATRQTTHPKKARGHRARLMLCDLRISGSTPRAAPRAT
jgi:hypothetical protein